MLRLGTATYPEYLKTAAANSTNSNDSTNVAAKLVRNSSSNYSSSSYHSNNNNNNNVGESSVNKCNNYYNNGGNLNTIHEQVSINNSNNNYNNELVSPRPTKSVSSQNLTNNNNNKPGDIVIKQIGNNQINFSSGTVISSNDSAKQSNNYLKVNNKPVVNKPSTELINEKSSFMDYHPVVSNSPSIATTNKNNHSKANLKRSKAKKFSFRRRFVLFAKKLKMKFRNYRNFKKSLSNKNRSTKSVLKHKSIKSMKSMKSTSSLSTASILLNDDKLAKKYNEKKNLKLNNSPTHTLKKKISLMGNTTKELNVIPPIVSNRNDQRDFSNGSQLTAQNVQRFLHISNLSYSPIKKTLIDQYVTDVSEHIETNYLNSIDTSFETIEDEETNQPNDKVIENKKTSRRSSIRSRSTKSRSSTRSRRSKNSIKSKSTSITEGVDPYYEEFVNNWASYLKTVIAQRTLLKLEINNINNGDISIGNYTTDAETNFTDDVSNVVETPPVRRLSVLEAILGDYSNEEDDDDNVTITETEEDRQSTGSSETVFNSSQTIKIEENVIRPNTAGTVVEKEIILDDDGIDELNPNVEKIERVVSNNDSISSGSTIDSIKTSTDDNTQYYSIIDSSENSKNIADIPTVFSDTEKSEDDFIIDTISRHNTVVIKQEFHDINNTKSILDILSLPETSISDIDEQNEDFNLIKLNNKKSFRTLTPSTKAQSDVSRSSSIASSVAPLNVSTKGPKKFNSMNDMNNLKLENNLKSNMARSSNQFINRPLSMRYNRKNNNVGIIRFLSQQHNDVACL